LARRPVQLAARTIPSSGIRRAREFNMSGAKIAALVLIIAGALALAYGGITYSKQTTALSLGPVQVNVTQKKTLPIPVWAGLGAILIGGVLLVAGSKRT
jgi:hypothetical protein